jgi:hypothetical protein
MREINMLRRGAQLRALPAIMYFMQLKIQIAAATLFGKLPPHAAMESFYNNAPRIVFISPFNKKM